MGSGASAALGSLAAALFLACLPPNLCLSGREDLASCLSEALAACGGGRGSVILLRFAFWVQC